MRIARRGLLAAMAVAPLLGCQSNSSSKSSTAVPTVVVTGPSNPFGLLTPSKIEAAIFDGGYGTEYAQFASDLLQTNHPKVEVAITKLTRVAPELENRLTNGETPDLIDNAGANQFGLSKIADQLVDLSDMVEATNLEGVPIQDTLYAGTMATGQLDDRQVAINYALAVYGIWYSASLFESNGWSPPTTWDDALTLGEKAAAQGKFLFLWGSEASDYFLELALASAIKEGGDEVRVAVDSLAADCWTLPAIQNTFEKLAECVAKDYVMPGGSGTQYLSAQALWSNSQQALLYPCGGWIANEMSDQTAIDFRMTVSPAPTVSGEPKLPFEAIHVTANESFIVPKVAKNIAGGKELLRVLLSKEAATNFAKTTQSPTVVKDTVPTDGFGSTALVSQVQLLGDAGSNLFSWRFLDYYSLGTVTVPAMNSFLEGNMNVATLTKTLQDATDRIREDDSIPKYEVS